VKINLNGIIAQPVIHRLGGAVNRRGSRRSRLRHTRDAGCGQAKEQEKRQTLFHGMPHFKFFFLSCAVIKEISSV
jgi:hypothetical protein